MPVNQALLDQLIALLSAEKAAQGQSGPINSGAGDLVNAMKAHKEQGGYLAEKAVHDARGKLRNVLVTHDMDSSTAENTVKTFVEAIKTGYYVWGDGPAGGGKSVNIHRNTGGGLTA